MCLPVLVVLIQNLRWSKSHVEKIQPGKTTIRTHLFGKGCFLLEDSWENTPNLRIAAKNSQKKMVCLISPSLLPPKYTPMHPSPFAKILVVTNFKGCKPSKTIPHKLLPLFKRQVCTYNFTADFHISDTMKQH